jgi:hypothetical protein
MTINSEKVNVMEITWGEGCTVARVPLFDKAETLSLDFGKDYPVGSDCYCYDPEKITFNANAKGKKMPFTAHYKSGGIFNGTLQRVTFNDREQKAYDTKCSKMKTMGGIKRDIEKREAEYKRKQSEQDELIRLQIRALKNDAGEPVGQTDHSYNTRVYCFQSWQEFKKSKHEVGFKYTYSKMLKDARYKEELKSRGVKSGKEIEKNIRAHRKNLKLKNTTSTKKTK